MPTILHSSRTLYLSIWWFACTATFKKALYLTNIQTTFCVFKKKTTVEFFISEASSMQHHQWPPTSYIICHSQTATFRSQKRILKSARARYSLWPIDHFISARHLQCSTINTHTHTHMLHHPAALAHKLPAPFPWAQTEIKVRARVRSSSSSFLIQ